MNKISMLVCMFTLSIFLQNCGQEKKEASAEITEEEMADEPTGTLASVEVKAEELSEIVSKEATIDTLAKDCIFTEGPLWVESENMLLFSDVPGNTIYKWTEENGKEVYLKPAGYTGETERGGFMGPNGLYLTDDNKLWICQHGDSRIAEMDAPINAPEPKFTTVVDSYNGKKLNSPNDLYMTDGGDLYFTDPPYGFEGGPNDPKRQLSFSGVYKMDEKRNLTLLIDSLNTPNGIAIFPDGKTLIVAETQGPKRGWYTYDVKEDGTLENGRVFFKPEQGQNGGCDGLRIDSNGNVFATGPGGVYIFDKSGKELGKIKVDGLTSANCALSPDEKSLYITATQYVLRVNMR